MSLFRLDASIRTEGSTSRAIADIVENSWCDGCSDRPVTRRSIGVEPLPSTAWAASVRAHQKDESAWTPEERDAACAWWQRAKSEFVLRPHVVEILTASVGKFETDDGFLLALEEALTSARSCAQCGTKVKTVMCSTCTPKPARPGPKPLTTTEQKPVGPDPIEEAKFKEIAKRLGLNDRADSYGPDSFTPLEDSK